MFNVNIGVSNHHVHLTEESYKILFGDAEFDKVKDLTQEGEFASDKFLTIKGPKGELEKFRFLGPFRDYNQVELSQSDAYLLGVNPPVRKSGDVENSAEVTIIGEIGEITDKCAILQQPHIHMNYEDLKTYGVSDDQEVYVHVKNKDSSKEGIFFAKIKAKPNGVLDFHIDRDEANAFMLETGDIGEVYLEKPTN